MNHVTSMYTKILLVLARAWFCIYGANTQLMRQFLSFQNYPSTDVTQPRKKPKSCFRNRHPSGKIIKLIKVWWRPLTLPEFLFVYVMVKWGEERMKQTVWFHHWEQLLCNWCSLAVLWFYFQSHLESILKSISLFTHCPLNTFMVRWLSAWALRSEEVNCHLAYTHMCRGPCLQFPPSTIHLILCLFHSFCNKTFSKFI